MEALRFNMKEAMMSPVIVTTVVAAASWLATTESKDIAHSRPGGGYRHSSNRSCAKGIGAFPIAKGF